MNKDQLKAALAKGARIQAWHLLPGATNSNQGQWDTLTPADGAQPEFGCEAHLYRVHPEDIPIIAELGQEVGAVAGLERIDGMEFYLHENVDDGDAEPVRLVMAMSHNNKVFCHRASQADNGVCATSPAHTSEARELTDAQCDAIYSALDYWTTNIDSYEFGLPTYAGGGSSAGRDVIRAAMRQEGGNG